MLVLTRKRKDSVVIGDGLVTVTVLEILDGKVRLGIEAPRDVPVHRHEVYEAIQRDARAAEGGGR